MNGGAEQRERCSSRKRRHSSQAEKPLRPNAESPSEREGQMGASLRYSRRTGRCRRPRTVTSGPVTTGPAIAGPVSTVPMLLQPWRIGR